jgi:type IV secretion system protein VirB8
VADGKKSILERTRALTESKNWYQDRYQTMLVQRNFLFILSFLSLIVLFFAASALATLINKKTFEPFVIAVEENTGAVTNVDQQSMQTFAGLDAVARYFIVQYIIARESFSPYTRNYNLQMVTNYSSEAIYNKYTSELKDRAEEFATNQNQNITKGVKVNNIFPMETNKDLGNLMNIRITVTDYAKGIEKKKQPFILLLRYKFLSEQAQKLELSYINPLNFRVLEYQRQADVTAGE